jgi:4-aminobutyrate--pyruvate transaminase
MKPHSISIAKALTSAYVPLGAVLIPDNMFQAMVDESRKLGTFGHGFTYSGHPVASAVALKTLEIYERDNVVGHVQSLMPTFERRLKAFSDHPLVGEARGKGLVGGVELVADKATKRAFDPKKGIGAKCVAFCQEEGVILRALGDTVAICPPLIITEAELNELFDRLGRALDKTEALVSQGGHRMAA